MSSRILLVEDTPVNIQAVSSILKPMGYHISVATSGQQALDILDRVRPDLILLDVMMPGIDGFETCRQIKNTWTWRDIPIIFLTARSDPADIVRGFEAGAVDYVSKPFNAPELLARVRTHLALDHLYRENQRLLLNVLPAPIAERLKKQEGGLIAERFDDVSVLFADLVGFTPLSMRLVPSELIELLNDVFSAFDALVERDRLEKIKTIGDAYMVAGGLPEPHSEHLAAMARLALDMCETLRTFPKHGDLQVRIGIHTGSAIAGVIGTRKFIYDVWGDTVNTASRLESHGAPAKVHVSHAVFERLNSQFHFEPRGCVDLKGRGPMQTYFLTGPIS